MGGVGWGVRRTEPAGHCPLLPAGGHRGTIPLSLGDGGSRRLGVSIQVKPKTQQRENQSPRDGPQGSGFDALNTKTVHRPQQIPAKPTPCLKFESTDQSAWQTGRRARTGGGGEGAARGALRTGHRRVGETCPQALEPGKGSPRPGKGSPPPGGSATRAGKTRTHATGAASGSPAARNARTAGGRATRAAQVRALLPVLPGQSLRFSQLGRLHLFP